MRLSLDTKKIKIKKKYIGIFPKNVIFMKKNRLNIKNMLIWKRRNLIIIWDDIKKKNSNSDLLTEIQKIVFFLFVKNLGIKSFQGSGNR